MGPFRSCSFALVIFALLLASSADATVLCAGRGGQVRLRERCRRHETRVDLRRLVSQEADPVPLRNWETEVPQSGREGSPDLAAAAAAAAPDATMLNVTPCRLIDTRPGTSSALPGDDVGAFADHEIRTYTVAGFCDVPTDATGLSINLAVVPGPASGFASVGPSGSIPAFPPGPGFASINFVGAGPALSNSLIVPLDEMGRIDVYAARSADVIIDTNGYFQPKDTGTNVVFVPGTGTDVENGTALLAAVSAVNALPAGTQVSIELGPGTFDVGTTTVSIERQTSLVGASQELTRIECDCGSNGVVRFTTGADGSSGARLTLENTGTGTNDKGVLFNDVDGCALRNVTVMTAGGPGMAFFGANDTLFEDSTLDSGSTGMQIGAVVSSVTIRRSTVTAGAHCLNLLTSNEATIEDSTLATLSGIHSAVATTTGVSVIARNSRLITSGATYVLGSAGSFDLADSFVDAGTISYTGTATCTATTTPGAFDDTGCP